MTEAALRHLAERIGRVQDSLGRRIAVENLSSYVRFAADEMAEHEFVAELLRRSDCLLLLDVNNVYVSSVNHGFDPRRYIDAMPADLVKRVWQPLPEALTIPQDAPELSGHPVEEAFAVVQKVEPDAGLDTDLHVIDFEGEWTRIDVGDLRPTRDEHGNQAYALRATSLSPDGRRVAVPQPQRGGEPRPVPPHARRRVRRRNARVAGQDRHAAREHADA